MRNSHLPKEVRESLKNQPTVADLPEAQRAEIQAHQDMLNESIPGRSHRDAILALEFLMGEDSTDKHTMAYKHALWVVNKYYGNDANDIITGHLDDGDKFTEDGESRGSNYQSGGLSVNEFMGDDMMSSVSKDSMKDAFKKVFGGKNGL